MRLGNIIAGFLLTPFFIMTALLIGWKHPSHPGGDGALIIVYIFSTYISLESFLYLIAKNGAYLEATITIKFINRHINIFRFILLALSVLMALSWAFAPRKPITPTKEAQTNPSSPRV